MLRCTEFYPRKYALIQQGEGKQSVVSGAVLLMINSSRQDGNKYPKYRVDTALNNTVTSEIPLKSIAKQTQVCTSG